MIKDGEKKYTVTSIDQLMNLSVQKVSNGTASLSNPDGFLSSLPPSHSNDVPVSPVHAATSINSNVLLTPAASTTTTNNAFTTPAAPTKNKQNPALKSVAANKSGSAKKKWKKRRY